jgi:hypothetical protein
VPWKKWFPEYRIPVILDRLVQASVLRDRTHENDIVPHFEAELRDGGTLVLWADHPSVDRRAILDGPRYGIEIYQAGRIPETVFESENIDEALEVLRMYISGGGGMRLF